MFVYVYGLVWYGTTPSTQLIQSNLSFSISKFDVFIPQSFQINENRSENDLNQSLSIEEKAILGLSIKNYPFVHSSLYFEQKQKQINATQNSSNDFYLQYFS